RRNGARDAKPQRQERVSVYRSDSDTRWTIGYGPARPRLPAGSLPDKRKMTMGSTFASLATALLAAAWPLASPAQTDYPAHTITMVVPFPPGGVADITARPLADAMGRILKQTVIVENKAGAGGGVGMQYVARAKPDGYTVLLALSSIS